MPPPWMNHGSVIGAELVAKQVVHAVKVERPKRRLGHAPGHAVVPQAAEARVGAEDCARKGEQGHHLYQATTTTTYYDKPGISGFYT